MCFARYVILHQEQGDRDPDPCNWRVAYTPQNHTWRGFSKEDAYGTALTYIETVSKHMHASMYIGAGMANLCLALACSSVPVNRHAARTRTA